MTRRRAAGRPAARRFTPAYTNYIASERWAAKRQAAMARYGSRCAACRTALNLKVHHLTYERLGRELISDLMILCQTHHLGVHREHRMAGRPDLRSFTYGYVARIRAASNSQ